MAVCELMSVWYACANVRYHVVDGRDITPLNEEQIRAECAILREKGISDVVLVGVFSPLDTEGQQEEKAKKIVLEEIPGADVVLSRDSKTLPFSS